jgi:hypothetical protein
MEETTDDIIQRMIQYRMLVYGMDENQALLDAEDFIFRRIKQIIEKSQENSDDILTLKKELSIFVSLERYKP